MYIRSGGHTAVRRKAHPALERSGTFNESVKAEAPPSRGKPISGSSTAGASASAAPRCGTSSTVPTFRKAKENAGLRHRCRILHPIGKFEVL